MISPTYLREKAAHCRRLGAGFVIRDDPTKIALEELAIEFDARAEALERVRPDSQNADTSAADDNDQR